MNMKPSPADDSMSPQELRERIDHGLLKSVFGRPDLKATLARYKRAIEALDLPTPHQLLETMVRNATDIRRR
jgi:hypothetical protein